jgi:hypothetical protein
MKKTKRGKFTEAGLSTLITAIGRQDSLVGENLFQRERVFKSPVKRPNPVNPARDIEAKSHLIRVIANGDGGFSCPSRIVHPGNEKSVEFPVVARAGRKAVHVDGRCGDVPDGTTSLMMAAGYGQVGMVKRLLRAKADVHALDEHRHNALFWALRWDKVESAKVLLRRGSKITEDVLCGPVKNGNAALVKMLITKGANPNAVFLRFDGDELWPNGETLLGYAVTVAGILDYPTEIIRLLVNAGANVNEPTEWFVRHGNGTHEREKGPVVPLHIAARRRMEDVMRLLWEAGAKETLQDVVQILGRNANSAKDSLLTSEIEQRLRSSRPI